MTHEPAPEPAQEQEQQHEQQPEQAWRRVHPISPFIRSWSALLIFVYLIMSFSVQELQGFIEAFNLSVGQSLLIMLGLVVAILLVAAGLYAISDRKSTRLNSSHVAISYAVFC